jgi:hypothetical protein
MSFCPPETCVSIILWTMGMGDDFVLYAQTWPFGKIGPHGGPVARRRSPRMKSGFIESERTTTSGILLRNSSTKIIQISAEERTMFATEIMRLKMFMKPEFTPSPKKNFLMRSVNPEAALTFRDIRIETM